MNNKTLVYWHGIVGIPGKGPNWEEPYNPNRTIGELIKTMTDYKCGEQNKRIEILKYQRGNLSRYDKNNPWWPHSTTLAEYLNVMGDTNFLVYVII